MWRWGVRYPHRAILCIGVLKIDTPDSKKYLASQPCQRYNTPNPKPRKDASKPGPADTAAPGQEAFLTPYLTTVRTGTRGNSGFKSVKKYSIPSGKCWKALQITTKNLVQAFGNRMPLLASGENNHSGSIENNQF